MFEVNDFGNFTLFDPKKDSVSKIAKSPGIYAILLRKGSKLPECGVEYVPCRVEYKGEEFELVYVGISNKGLYQRDYKNHFNGHAGKSTLRKSLGSLMGLKKTFRSENEKGKDSGSIKTKFIDKDEDTLSFWMNDNLLLLFKTRLNPEELETEMINILNPPLNISKNRNIENAAYRKRLSELRNDLSDLK